MKIFLNSKLIDADHSLLHSLTPGLVTGKGVFETMRTYRQKIFALDQHLMRMKRGLNLYQIKKAISKKEVKRQVQKLMILNGLKNARVRIMIWKKNKKTHSAVVCQKLSLPSLKKYKLGYHAEISNLKRDKTKYSHIKSLNYQKMYSAFQLAQKNHFDEAILLNQKKEIVEGSRTNIFWIKKNTLFTPAIRTGCLNGITRQHIIDCAKELNIRIKKVNAKMKQLKSADEAFLTNSGLGLIALTKINRSKIGRGKPGDLTRALQNKYKKLVLNNIA